MHWIIQENICQEKKWSEMIDALDRFNISYSIHKLVPFVGDLIPEPNIKSNKIWCMGGISMGNLCKRKGWTPGVLELPDYGVQLNSPWKDQYLNNKVMFRYVEQLSNFQDMKKPDELWFIKPDNDSKFIAGQLMTTKEIREWAYRIVELGENDGSNVSKNSMVIITHPKNIRKEARFWIVNDHVVTWSLYKLGQTVTPNRLLVDKNMVAYAHWLCSKMSFSYWRPADAYCLDIAEINDNQYKIVEINNINSSGFYDCDMQKLVCAIDMEFK